MMNSSLIQRPRRSFAVGRSPGGSRWGRAPRGPRSPCIEPCVRGAVVQMTRESRVLFWLHMALGVCGPAYVCYKVSGVAAVL